MQKDAYLLHYSQTAWLIITSLIPSSTVFISYPIAGVAVVLCGYCMGVPKKNPKQLDMHNQH
jgi:hypothetical protein